MHGLESAFAALREAYGSHQRAAWALGIDEREYRRIRRGKLRGANSACRHRLLLQLAAQQVRRGGAEALIPYGARASHDDTSGNFRA